MLIKSRRALAATAVALAAAGGGSAVVIRAASSSSTSAVSPAALPSAAGPAATAAVPYGGGGADGTGQAAPAVPASPAGSGASGQQQAAPGSSAPQQAAAPAGSAAGGSGSGSEYGPGSGTAAAAAMLPRSAGQGDAGPLTAGSIPADGAVPGASAAFQQLAAARAAQTVLPHSPQLLAQLGGSSAQGSASPSTGPSTTALVASTAAPKTLAGLDVAQFQHPVNTAFPGGQAIAWTSVDKAGYRFAAVKATEGDYYVNSWAAADLAGAKAAGLDVAPYHFAVPNESGGAAQAKFAVQYSGYKSGPRMLPLMLDIEYDPYTSTDHTNQCYGLSTIKMKAWLSAFVTEARTLTSQYPLIYTTANWWSSCTAKATAFGNDPMWVAAYGTPSPPMPAGWKSWTFWQHSSAGTVAGVNAEGTTDMDYFSPAAVGLVSPGTLSTRARARVWLQLGCLGATAGEKLTYQVSGLPPGLSISKAGAIGGTLKASAATSATRTYLVTVAARNAAGVTAKVKFSWKVAPA